MENLKVLPPLEKIERPQFLSPIHSEREAQLAALKRIWPGFPEGVEAFQCLNGLLMWAEAHLKQGRCEQCRFWRDKAWDGDKGWGICDNPKMFANILSEGMIAALAGISEGAARAVRNSAIRFENDFSCCWFEPYPETP